jgi:branched-chain amino acid aminotransferase
VTQDTVIDLAAKRGIDAEFKKMLPEELWDAEECFLTGTAAEIIPVIKIDDKVIGDGKPGELTQQLRQDYRRLTENEGVEY